MMLIFILAGAFSNTAEKMGGVKSTVNLGLSLIPENLIIVGLFVICMFVSISMGTSVGTVAAIAPVGYGFAQATDVPTALAMATVVGGAMFGDNLSMISDTTIAAVRTQHTKMKDKFRVNFKIVLPGAILTIIILYFLTNGISLNHAKNYDYNLIKVVPYILVLVLALLGVKCHYRIDWWNIISRNHWSHRWFIRLDGATRCSVQRYYKHGRYCYDCVANWWFSRYYSTQWWY